MKGRWRKDKRSDPTLQGPAVVAVSPSPGEPLSSTSTVSSLPSLSEYPPPLPHSEGLGTSPGEDLLRADKGGRTDAAAEEDRGRSCSKTRVSQSQPAPPSREYLQDTASFFSRQRMAQLAKHCPSAEVQQRNVGALYACQSIKKNKEFALCDTDTHAAFKVRSSRRSESKQKDHTALLLSQELFFSLFPGSHVSTGLRAKGVAERGQDRIQCRVSVYLSPSIYRSTSFSVSLQVCFSVYYL